jgi:two-component system response regulator YesN
MDWKQEGFLIAGEASNGQEALELIESIHPHIIITDIVMPIMDGEELTRVVKQRYPDIQIIILSSYGEYDYVRSTFQNGVVDYILKPQLDAQSLLKGLQNAASRISLPKKTERNTEEHPSVEQVINKLILGYRTSVDEEFLSSAFPFHQFFLLGVDVRNHSSHETLEWFKEKVEDELRLNIRDGVFYSFSFNKNFFALLLNVNENKIADLAKLCDQIAEQEHGIGFALTEAFHDFMQIGKIYQENLLKLMDYRFYLSDQPLLMKQNLPKEQPLFKKFNLDWFTEELKHEHFDNAFTYLKDHASGLSRCCTMEIFEYKAFFSNIIFNITILLSNLDYDVKELDKAKYAYFKSFDEVSTAQEAVELLEDFIEEAKKCLLVLQNQYDNVNLKKLVEYMKEHYAEPLTLTEMAKHFHFNPSYLSSYFSTHMHEGFIEYLNKIRIEEAAELLIEDHASISEISGMVGYSDHSYFCKVFKKVKGLSPSQYKRKHT